MKTGLRMKLIMSIDMEKLIILDFTTGEVDIYNIDMNYEPCMEDLLPELGHNANNCQWMFTQGDITIHNEVLK